MPQTRVSFILPLCLISTVYPQITTVYRRILSSSASSAVVSIYGKGFPSLYKSKPSAASRLISSPVRVNVFMVFTHPSGFTVLMISSVTGPAQRHQLTPNSFSFPSWYAPSEINEQSAPVASIKAEPTNRAVSSSVRSSIIFASVAVWFSMES